MPWHRPTHRRTVLIVLVALLGAVAPSWATAQGDADAFLHLPLVDAVTGEAFTLADYAGTPLVVEAMATWCGNCLRQLGHLGDAVAALTADGAPVAAVAISVEVGLADEQLAAYAARTGFPLRFAVADAAFLQAWVDRFGRVAANPSSTPHAIVAADGTVGTLTTGFVAPDVLVERLRAAAR